MHKAPVLRLKELERLRTLFEYHNGGAPMYARWKDVQFELASCPRIWIDDSPEFFVAVAWQLHGLLCEPKIILGPRDLSRPKVRMRYCVAHDEYFLDSVGKIIRTEMAECSRRRTLFLVPAGDIADSTTCAFEKERGESNDRNGIPVFPRRCLHFVWFSRTQAKHLIAEIRNWPKKT